jgi:hypothetical protein
LVSGAVEYRSSSWSSKKKKKFISHGTGSVQHNINSTSQN